MTTFNQFGLKEELVQAVEAMGFTEATPIQEETIPLLISGKKDIIALAQTGTGKTAAFGLPLLHKVDLHSKHTQGLVLSPTRELCMQIQQELSKYGAKLHLQVTAVYGGASISQQIKELRQGAQIIVATPGRLMDLMEKGAVRLEEVHTVILDEADEMLNMGFRDDIDFILKNAESKQETWLFSATINKDVRRIAKRYMSEPVEVAVAKENIGNANIDHQFYITSQHQRYDALQRLLDFVPDIYGIIFTRTKQDAHDISEKLMKEGYHVSALHGDMDQKMRTKVMDRFKKKAIRVVVATDVAARGIDVSDITHVINYELPDDPEIYTHRSGRTARAGKSGVCLSITTPREQGKLRQIERMVKSEFHKCDIPDGKEVIRKRLFHFLEELESTDARDEISEIYQKAIKEKFEGLSKDELINRLLWLQLRQTMENYQNAPDLNMAANAKDKGRTRSGGNSEGRIFINLGTKDGLTAQLLGEMVNDLTGVQAKDLSQITVNELATFFNVPPAETEKVMKGLANQRFDGRKIRVDDADGRPPRGDGYKGKSGGGRGYQGDRREGGRGRGAGSNSYKGGSSKGFRDKDKFSKGKRPFSG